MTGQFKEITCEEARILIETCASKSTDRIVWGRFKQHLIGCLECYQLMFKHHELGITKIVAEVVTQDATPEYRHYCLVREVTMHFARNIFSEYPDGDLTEQEKEMVTEHFQTCAECRKLYKDS